MPDDTPPSRRRTLVLIGLRASGKSTHGGRLADRNCERFVDLDRVVAEAFGVSSAAEAIRVHGLEGFRQQEAESLERVFADQPGVVLSLGGGTPTAPGSERALRDAVERGAASVCYLRARPVTLADRLARTDTETRPSLTGAGTLEEVGELFAQRDGLYRDLADRVIETDGLDEDETLELLVEWAQGARGG